SDDRAQNILAACRSAMSPASRLLVLEMIVEPEATFSKRMDLMMMAWTGGRERTQHEFEQLLSNAGFRLICTYRTITPICVLEAELA
ncbi:MAG: methyltransferase, partial [Xanthobacteraceae bacterium]